MTRQTKHPLRTIPAAIKSVAILLVFAITLSSCSVNDAELVDDAPDVVPIDTPNAPNFTLTSSTGSVVSLSSFSNTVVVLFFFGNNCPSCRAVAPNIQNMLVTPYAARTDYAVLGLDQWNGNTASVVAFKTTTNVTFPLLLNAASVAAAYKTTYDRIVVIDKTGRIAFKGNQSATSDIAAARAKVIELLAN